MSNINDLLIKVFKGLSEKPTSSKSLELFRKAILKNNNGFSIEFLNPITIKEMEPIDLNALLLEIEMSENIGETIKSISTRLDSLGNIAREEVFL